MCTCDPQLISNQRGNKIEHQGIAIIKHKALKHRKMLQKRIQFACIIHYNSHTCCEMRQHTVLKRISNALLIKNKLINPTIIYISKEN